MTRGRWIAGAVVLLVLGFLAGRRSSALTAADRADLARLRQTEAGFQRERAALVRVATDAVHQAVEWQQAAFRWEGEARGARRRADQAGARAAGLAADLAGAGTAADSIPILVALCAARAEECSALRAANVHLDSALAAERHATEQLTVADSAHRAALALDATRLTLQRELLARLERRALGCRVPLLGLRCPRLGLGVGATLVQGEVRIGPVAALILPLP